MKRDSADWLPRAVRKQVSLHGLGQWEDGSRAPVLVANISYEGCEIWSDHELCTGETLKLALAGQGEIDAQVRWVLDGRAGARFLIGNCSDARRARIGV